MRPLTNREREALDRLLATKFPRADYREIVGNAMLAGVAIVVAIGLACLLVFGGPR